MSSQDNELIDQVPDDVRQLLLPVADSDDLDKEISTDNGEKTAALIGEFLESYETHKDSEQPSIWLESQFRKYPELWKDEEEIRNAAREVVDAIDRANEAKSSLISHLKKGQSQASWLALKIEKGAQASGVTEVGSLAIEIDRAVEEASENALGVITTRGGSINGNKNLDGFIAEQYHVDSFNIDAASKGSSYRAEVCTPGPGETYGKNSVDILIRDANGKVVRRYQSKYGADAKKTEALFDKGDYRGQGKLVPEGHSEGIQKKSSEVIEIDGVTSKPLAKDGAKEYQRKAQEEQEAKVYDWSDTNRISIAKRIGKQALIGACIASCMQGGRILARRSWNGLTGKENPTVTEDLKEFLASSLSSSTQVGVQVAISGALVIAAKSGWLGKTLKNTPVGRIANIAFVGLENIKILYRLSRGELSAEEALDAMGETTAAAICGLMGAAEGAAIGASIGIVFGPIGIGVGGFVGGVVGGIVGGEVGSAIYEATVAVAKVAVKRLKRIGSTIGRGLVSLGEGLEVIGRNLSEIVA